MQISEAEASRAHAAEEARRAAELNRQLSDQNTQVLERQAALQKSSIELQNQSNQRLAAMQGELGELEGIVKGIGNQRIAVAPPSAPVPEGREGNVSRRPDGIHIQVAGSVLFDPGHAELRSSASETLSRVAHTLKAQYPNHSIRIEGHTDSTPVVHSRDRYPDNMALSQARAAAVYDFLVKRGGLSAGKMYTAGYGDRQPLVSPERTTADRAKNRRVEIVILPNNLRVQKDQLTHAEGPAKPYRASMAVTK
jgi:chemotaxis protein MotB